MGGNSKKASHFPDQSKIYNPTIRSISTGYVYGNFQKKCRSTVLNRFALLRGLTEVPEASFTELNFPWCQAKWHRVIQDYHTRQNLTSKKLTRSRFIGVLMQTLKDKIEGTESQNSNGESATKVTQQLFKIRDVAEMLGISTKSVRRLLDRDLLKASTAFRHKLISASSVEQFVINTTK